MVCRCSFLCCLFVSVGAGSLIHCWFLPVCLLLIGGRLLFFFVGCILAFVAFLAERLSLLWLAPHPWPIQYRELGSPGESQKLGVSF